LHPPDTPLTPVACSVTHNWPPDNGLRPLSAQDPAKVAAAGDYSRPGYQRATLPRPGICAEIQTAADFGAET
jgi:hypothetical protein